MKALEIYDVDSLDLYENAPLRSPLDVPSVSRSVSCLEAEVRFGNRADVFVVVVFPPDPCLELSHLGDNGAAVVCLWLRLILLDDAGVALATADALDLLCAPPPAVVVVGSVGKSNDLDR